MTAKDMLTEILTTVRNLDGTVKNLERKLDVLENGLSSANLDISALKSENLSLKAANYELNLRMDDFAMRFEALEVKVATRFEALEAKVEKEAVLRDDNEANSRLQSLEISGIPKKEGETYADCKRNSAAVLALLGSENDIKAIDVAHRKMSGAMIVRFKSREQRDEVYLKRFNLI